MTLWVTVYQSIKAQPAITYLDVYFANISATNRACDELLHIVHRDGKAKPLAACEYPAVYTDDLALQVDQWPAAVTGVDSGISLDILIASYEPQGGNDATRYR